MPDQSNGSSPFKAAGDKLAAPAPERSEEMKKSLGLPSTYQSANTNPVPEPAGYHPDKPMSLGEHLRNIMGAKSEGGPPPAETRNPAAGGKTIMETVTEAVNGAPKVPEHGE